MELPSGTDLWNVGGVGEAADDGLARPIDFGQRYGAGLGTGLSLGGGGIFFVAWQVTYLYEMAQRGIDLGGADRVIGTSAGSVVSSVLESGRIERLYKEITVLARLPRLVSLLAPAAGLAPSQERAKDLFTFAPDAAPERLREIGHAALAARTPKPSTMPRNISLILGRRTWPTDRLNLTVVDAYTGERCVVNSASGVSLPYAVAASSAVPGLFAPPSIGDRRCMDGGVCGTGVHLDLLAGAERVVVLCLTDGEGIDFGGMTTAPGMIRKELDALRSSGSELFFRKPHEVDFDTLMDPKAVPDAIAMARDQASADARELSEFLGAAGAARPEPAVVPAT